MEVISFNSYFFPLTFFELQVLCELLSQAHAPLQTRMLSGYTCQLYIL